MDKFKVPKKVNRHVLKAIYALSDGKPKEFIPTADIINEVKYQMRSLVPVSDVDHVIQKSLENMSEIGLIERRGWHRFGLGRSYGSTPQPLNPNSPNRRIFRPTHHQDDKSRLDPNLKRVCHSEDSLSGDDFDRTRKRMRSNNKQLKNKGRSAELPRARQHKPNRLAAIDTPLFATLHHQQSPSDFQRSNNCNDLDFRPGSSLQNFSLDTVIPVFSSPSEQQQKLMWLTNDDDDFIKEEERVADVYEIQTLLPPPGNREECLTSLKPSTETANEDNVDQTESRPDEATVVVDTEESENVAQLTDVVSNINVN